MWIKIEETQLPAGIKWETSRGNQGQAVEESDGFLGGAVPAHPEYRRVTDRSIPETTYYRSIPDYQASLARAIEWARTAEEGDYLVRYADTGLTPEEDPGSRCGFSDDELAQIGARLGKRGLALRTDDRGLLARFTGQFT